MCQNKCNNQAKLLEVLKTANKQKDQLESIKMVCNNYLALLTDEKETPDLRFVLNEILEQTKEPLTRPENHSRLTRKPQRS